MLKEYFSTFKMSILILCVSSGCIHSSKVDEAFYERLKSLTSCKVVKITFDGLSNSKSQDCPQSFKSYVRWFPSAHLVSERDWNRMIEIPEPDNIHIKTMNYKNKFTPEFIAGWVSGCTEF